MTPGIARKLTVFAATSLLLGLAVSTAHAEPVLTIDQGDLQAGGFVYYLGGGGPLHGSQIQFFNINGQGTQANADENIPCDVCFMNFETGNIQVNAGNQFEFAGGGSLTLDGTVEFPDDPPGFVTDNIVTGEFTETGGLLPTPALVVFPGTVGQFVSFGFDIKMPELVDFFGENVENWTFSENVTTGTFVRQCDPGDPGMGIDPETPATSPEGDPCFTFGEEFSLSDLEGDGRYFGLNDVTLTIGQGGFLLAVDTSDFTNRPRVPVPGTSVLMLLGVSALVVSRRRRR